MALANPPLADGAVKQRDGSPTRKVLAGGIAGALATIIVFILNTYVTHDKPITAEIALALSTVLSFIISYVIPPAARDQVTNE